MVSIQQHHKKLIYFLCNVQLWNFAAKKSKLDSNHKRVPHIFSIFLSKTRMVLVCMWWKKNKSKITDNQK